MSDDTDNAPAGGVRGHQMRRGFRGGIAPRLGLTAAVLARSVGWERLCTLVARLSATLTGRGRSRRPRCTLRHQRVFLISVLKLASAALALRLKLIRMSEDDPGPFALQLSLNADAGIQQRRRTYHSAAERRSGPSAAANRKQRRN